MMPDFSHVDLNSLKLKVKRQKCLPGCSQKRVQQSGHGTQNWLYLK